MIIYCMSPFITCKSSKHDSFVKGKHVEIEIRSGLPRARGNRRSKVVPGNFLGDGNVVYLDRGVGKELHTSK